MPGEYRELAKEEISDIYFILFLLCIISIDRVAHKYNYVLSRREIIPPETI